MLCCGVRVVVLQAEPRAALSLASRGASPLLRLDPSDLILYSAKVSAFCAFLASPCKLKESSSNLAVVSSALLQVIPLKKGSLFFGCGDDLACCRSSLGMTRA